MEELLARILHACAQVRKCPNQLRSATQQLSTRDAKLIQKFKRTGPVENEARSERSKTATDEGRPTSTMVLIAMVESPKKRTLRLSAELHILHTNKWNPYKMQMLQHPDGKVQFFYGMLEQVRTAGIVADSLTPLYIAGRRPNRFNIPADIDSTCSCREDLHSVKHLLFDCPIIEAKRFQIKTHLLDCDTEYRTPICEHGSMSHSRDMKKKNRIRRRRHSKKSIKDENIAANQFSDSESDIDVILDDETDVSVVPSKCKSLPSAAKKTVTRSEPLNINKGVYVIINYFETWTLTLREEQRLRVFENKILRKIFGAKRDEVAEEWRKLHNAELHALFCSPDIIRNIKSRRLRWAWHVARMGEPRNAYRVFVGRSEGKRPFGEAETENDTEANHEQEKEFVGSLDEKKLPTEGCTGRNGEREKSLGQKKISDERRHEDMWIISED
ncbi:hypothetical protein ANN_22312 [Periplaneta americana]|uniref:Reverse transcriptase n=1 Tax=Periplaneta americana TaxID=6978 RepID=A0ABQ8S8S0_PERAM|nr:hypothetical protein ANN_22312 [Periplaneta americana]